MRSDVLFVDRGYDSETTRNALRPQSIEPVIDRRSEDLGSSLGQVRWVVERTISWFKGFRRIRVRYNRLILIQQAWNESVPKSNASGVRIRPDSRWMAERPLG